MRAAHLKLIFGASSDFVTHTSHPALSNLFGYVEWFTKPRAVPHETMEMFEVDHQMWPDKLRRQGGVIKLEWIVQPCPLVPHFPKNAEELKVTEDTCLTEYNKFWINCFHDQAIYESVF
jgi:hypothetical protein